jgi:hypothetical protein
MKRRFLHLYTLVIITTLLTACTPKAIPTPTVDVIGTRSVELASMMLTQTVAAYSPTPLPSPTFTATPSFTETPTLPPAPVETVMPKVIEANGANDAYCFLGPNPDVNKNLSSTISSYKDVTLVGVGSVPGWYVIINPYFRSQCWIESKNLVLDPSFDISTYPTITP